MSGSSTLKEEAAQPAQRQENDPISPAEVHCGIEDDTLMSSAMHPSPVEVTRAEAASVVPKSPTNPEIDALEIGGGSLYSIKWKFSKKMRVSKETPQFKGARYWSLNI